MNITLQQLQQLIPKNPYVSQWHHALSQLLPDYEINTAERIAAFVAQCAHESAGFTALKENLNYKAATLRKIFPKYFMSDYPNMFSQRKEQRKTPATGSNVKNTSDSASTHLDRERGKG